MISAMQGAKLKAANNLHAARNALLDSVSLICMSKADRDRIHAAVSLIDTTFAGHITNLGPNPDEENQDGL